MGVLVQPAIMFQYSTQRQHYRTDACLPGATTFTLPFGAILTISFFKLKHMPYIIAAAHHQHPPLSDTHTRDVYDN